MSDTKLKPCPFCGCNLRKCCAYYLHEINGCILENYKFFESDFKQWNTRKPIDRIVESLNKEINGQAYLFNEAKRRGNTNQMAIHEYARQCYEKVVDTVKDGVKNE